MNRILYSMCYDMLEQNHTAFKTKEGLAITCPGKPLWLAHSNNIADVRLFFCQFLQQNKKPLSGIVAEKEIALTCAEIYGKKFTTKEMISYYLPREVVLPPTIGELKPYTAEEKTIIHKWLHSFYSEALNSEFPTHENNFQETQENISLFVLHCPKPVAMGLLVGRSETCRLNLIYVPPHLRGNGYGLNIVSALANKARSANLLPVLYTYSDNTKANNLYTKLGFREAGRLCEIIF